MPSSQGRCLCGALRYAFDPNGVLWRAHCHCESCRRATSSPVTTFLAVRDTALRWIKGAPAIHTSSPGVHRGFCATCGSPMSYANDELPGETHLYAASLIDASGFQPEQHDFWVERVDWLSIADDLPKRVD